MAMSSEEKGGQELAAAWLRRGQRQQRQVEDAPPQPQPPSDKSVRHPDTHRGFARV